MTSVNSGGGCAHVRMLSSVSSHGCRPNSLSHYCMVAFSLASLFFI